jgi:hypothetical protein
MRIYYGHLASINVKAGQHVRAGQQIGVMGGSGSSGENHFATHLHLGVAQNHNRPIHAATRLGAPGWINPVPWLRSKGITVGTTAPIKPGSTTSTSTASSSSKSSSSSSSSSYERRRTNRDDVPIRSHRNHQDDSTIVGYAHTKGYRLNVVTDDPDSSWTRVRWEVDGKYGNYWVASAHLEPGKASAPTPSGTYDIIDSYRSPNYHTPAQTKDYYGVDRTIEEIVIHHWGADGQDFNTPGDWLSRKNGTSSAHEVIEAGRVELLVKHENTAWHAGGEANPKSIGLELRPEAGDDDYATAGQRIADIRAEHGDIPLKGHSDYMSTACPGRYDLARLNRIAGGATGLVRSAHTSSGRTGNASSDSGLEWPENRLYVDGDFGPVTRRAYQRLLAPASVGNYKGWIDGNIGPLTVRAEQRWLQSRGYYRGFNLDGQRGYYTIRELQKLLRDRGFYGGWIDGHFGPVTVRALQSLMNSQQHLYQ